MNLPLWGLLSLLGAFCGLLSLPVSVVLGLKGNEWAWKNRRFDSVEHFKRVQRVWAIVGISLTLALILGYAGMLLVSLAMIP